MGWEATSNLDARAASRSTLHISLGLDKRFALPALWALGGIPIPVPRNDWKCQACGAEWQEVESDEPGTDAPGPAS